MVRTADCAHSTTWQGDNSDGKIKSLMKKKLDKVKKIGVMGQQNRECPMRM